MIEPQPLNSETIRILKRVIHPVFTYPVLQCRICTDVFGSISFIKDTQLLTCNNCLKAPKSNPREKYPTVLFKNDMKYDIPFNSSRIVFFFNRSSGNKGNGNKHSSTPVDGAFNVEFLKAFANLDYMDGSQVFPGLGNLYVIPEKYFKIGKAATSLVYQSKVNGYPTFSDMINDINFLLATRKGIKTFVENSYLLECTISIQINRMDDLSISPFHLVDAFSRRYGKSLPCSEGLGSKSKN